MPKWTAADTERLERELERGLAKDEPYRHKLTCVGWVRGKSELTTEMMTSYRDFYVDQVRRYGNGLGGVATREYNEFLADVFDAAIAHVQQQGAVAELHKAAEEYMDAHYVPSVVADRLRRQLRKWGR